MAFVWVFFPGQVIAVCEREKDARQQAHIVQGQFESGADQASLQRAMAKTFGGELRIRNPTDIPANGDGLSYDRFGSVLAVSGDTAIVVVPRVDSAYVFIRVGTQWSQQATLPTGAALGRSVALSGDTALIGAPGDQSAGGVVTGAVLVYVRTGSVWSQQTKLYASDANQGDAFGNDVALSGDTALIGSVTDDSLVGGVDSGSAYVFVRSGELWTEQAQLFAGNAISEDHFGESVALFGDTAVVGAPFADDQMLPSTGAAYVFLRNGTQWQEQAMLRADDREANDFFGTSVALFADSVLVGAPSDSTPLGVDAGSAYVFTRSSTIWSQQQRLGANDAEASDNFGNSVDLFGDTALVGASLDNTVGGSNAGSAYVFTRAVTVWTQRTTLIAANAAVDDMFGTSAALSGDTVLIGSPGVNTAAGPDAGAALVFTGSGSQWTQQASLTNGVSARNNYFGFSVALSGDTALVGAPGFNTYFPGDFAAGSAFVFFRVGEVWGLQAILTPGDSALGDEFGVAVALYGDTALVGASRAHSSPSMWTGASYVFTRSGASWSQQAKLVASDAAYDDYFGGSVALTSDAALIGAPLDDNRMGSAYVFTRDGTLWSQQAKLTAADRAIGDIFGYSVALSGETALVGSVVDDSQAGSAYVYTRSGTVWSAQTKLVAADRAANDRFGASVALSGDSALIGAPGDSTATAFQSGSVYPFTRSGVSWGQQTKLTASGAAEEGDGFGYSVALFNDAALVGAKSLFYPTPYDDTGSAYVFTRKGAIWIEAVKLKASDGADTDGFAASVALADGIVLVGAPTAGWATDPYANVGLAHVFTDPPTDAIFASGFE